MFIHAINFACGGKQAGPEAPVDEPAETPEETVEETVAAPADAATASGGAEGCAEGAVIYQQLNAPLRAPDDAAMQWTLEIHDTGYWRNTAPNGEQSGCLSEEDLTNLHAALAEAEIAALPLEPGMARCMAMPMTQYTVTVGEQSATWRGPCGDHNPSATLNELIGSIKAMSYGRE